MPKFAFPALDWYEFGENFQEGGFTRPVGTDQGDAFLFLDFKVQIGINQVIPISLTDSREGGHPLPTPGRLRKAKVNRGIGFLGWINPHHFFQGLNPGLGLGGFGCLGPKAADEVLMMGDFPLLVAVSRKVLGFTFFFLDQKIIKVSGVAM